MDEKELQKLYAAISAQFDIGDYNSFKSKMQTSEQRKSFYDAVGKNGFDIGDYDQYEQRISGVKKKESPFPLPSSYLSGGGVGSSVGSSEEKSNNGWWQKMAEDAVQKSKEIKKSPTESEKIVHLSGKNQLLPAGKVKPPTEEEVDIEVEDRLGDIMFGQNEKWKDPLKAIRETKDKNILSPKELAVGGKLNKIVTNQFLADGYKAKEALSMVDAWKNADKSNVTANALKFAANRYDKTVEPLRNILIEPGTNETVPDDIMDMAYSRKFQQAAVKEYARKHPEFSKELETAGKDISGNFDPDILPDGKLGIIVSEYYNNPDVRTFATKENPSFAPILNSLQRNLLFKNPTFGKNVMANEISRAIQESGWNDIDPLFNFENKQSRNFANTMAQQLYGNDPKKMEFFKQHQDEIVDNLDMPSFFEGTASGIKSFFQGVANTATQPFTSNKANQLRAWKKEASNVSANPDGVLKFLRDSGHTFGLVGSIAATGNVLGGAGLGSQGGNAASVGIGFFGDQLEDAKLKYPNNPVKAWTSAAFNTSLYMALSYDVTKQASKAAFGKVKPELDKVVNNLTNGSITREAARQQSNNILRKAFDFASGATKTNTRITAELTGIEMLNRGLDKIMGLDDESFDKFHSESISDMAKSMFLSNAMLSGVMQVGQMRRGNKLLESNLYEAASNPKQYERLIEQAKVKDPTLNAEEMINNLRFLTETKLKLEQQGIPEKNQARFLFEEMKGRVLSENLKSSPESSITRRGKEDLKTSEEIREAILNGEDAETFKTDAERKQDEKREDAKKEIDSLTKNRELDNKEIDTKIQNLDKESPTYLVQKARLEQQRTEKNDTYDTKIKKLQEEFPEPEDPRRGPEMEGLMEELKKKAADTEQFADLQYFIDKATEDPGEFSKRFGKDATAKLLEYVSNDRLQESYQKALDADLMDAADSIAKEMDRREQELPKGQPEQISQPIELSPLLPEEKRSAADDISRMNEAIDEMKRSSTDNQSKEIKNETEQTTVEGTEPVTPEETIRIEEPVTETEPAAEAPKGAQEQPSQPIDVGVSGEAMIGITHDQMNQTARELGLPDYEKSPETVKEWDIQVDERLKKDPNAIQKMLNRLRDGKVDDPIDQRMMLKYIASLKDRINKNPTDELLAEFKRARNISDIAGRNLGKGLVARKGSIPVEDTLADYLLREMDLNQEAPLTEGQKEKVQKEYQDISETESALNERMAGMEAERAKTEAEKNIPKKEGKKRDWKKEKEDIFSSIKDKLKKSRGETQATVVPYLKELIAISPDVAKLVKVLVEQGVDKLGDIVKEVHDVLKMQISGIQERDVIDLIAGKYNERNPTRNQLAEKLRDLKTEAHLTGKLEDLMNGIEPKSEKKKIQRNIEIEKLKKQIKEHDLTKLADYKRRTQKEIEKVEEQIRAGKFDPEPKKEPLKLDAEAQKLKDKLIELRNKRELRILQREYENSSAWNKFVTNAANILNVPRTLMASVDYSAPLRQALLPTVGHPLMALKSAGNMFRASFSKKFYDRWFDELEKSPGYQLMKDAKLGLTNTKDPKLTAKEEEYMSNLAQKIPFIGREIRLGSGIQIPFTGKKVRTIGGLISGSERAYSMYLNKMRVDLFNRFADPMKKDGRTWQNSEKEYKAVAAFVNNMTGRGDLGETLNKATPILSSLFFSPRLMASRFNTLTYLTKPSFYNKVPSNVRKGYFRNMVSTAGLGLTILGMAKMAGAETEDDPRSPDFGKIKVGNTRWDIWGGHQQYIKTAAQLISGQKKSSTSGKITEMGETPISGTRLGTVMDFFRGKAAPVPSVIYDLLDGQNAVGEKLTTDWVGGKKEIGLGRYLAQHLLPLTATGLSEALRDQGGKAWFTVGVPAAFGIGVQTYKPKEQDYSDEDRKDPVFKYFLDKGAELPQIKAGNIEIEDKDGKTLKKLEEYGDEAVVKFRDTRKKYLKEELQAAKDGDITIYVDSFGRISTSNDDPKKEKEEISIDKLNEKQMKELLSILGSNATKKTKTELYGEE